jgi:predicted transcriptional regulator
MKLSTNTLENIKKSEADIKAGRVHTLEEVEKRLKL